MRPVNKAKAGSPPTSEKDAPVIGPKKRPTRPRESPNASESLNAARPKVDLTPVPPKAAPPEKIVEEWMYKGYEKPEGDVQQPEDGHESISDVASELVEELSPTAGLEDVGSAAENEGSSIFDKSESMRHKASVELMEKWLSVGSQHMADVRWRSA